MISQLPAGRVTFAFTDVVGSTRLFDQFGDAYVAELRRMHRLIAETVARFGGAVVSTEGDGAFLAFPTAGQALDALCTVQDALERDTAAASGGQPALRIRAGAHTGHAVPLGGEYVSLAVHVAARVASTANAGQVVASQSVQHDLDKPRGTELGRFRLKDIAEPVTLWRVCGPDVPLRAAPERVTNVPTPRTSFVGRAAELTTLRSLIEEPAIVTVTGTGGIGKSRLAAELCRQTCDQLPGGAWLADLAAVEDGSSVVGAAAAAIGSEAFTDALAAELNRRGDMLLVLDGCEHVIDAAADLVAQLAERCPHLRALCTSREALDLDGEQVLRLQPLDSGAGHAQPGAAEQLFLDRAAAAGATVSPSDLPAVARICRLLDGLPLAVELAAARLPILPAPALADALAGNQIRLQRRGGPRHQRTLADLVAWSVRLLAPPERVALLALSVFPGRFDAAAAKEVLAAVPDAAADALPELTRRSLVDLDGDRYRLLATIRTYAADELGRDPQVSASAGRALFDWAVRGCPEPTALQHFVDDFDTARAVFAALDWGLDVGAAGTPLLLRRVRTWADQTGGDRTVRDLAARIVRRPAPRTADEVILQAIALDLTVGLGWHVREGVVDADRVERLIAAAREVDDVLALRQAIAVGATMMSKLGRHDRAKELGRECADLAQREPSLAAFRGIHIGDLALIHYVDGDVANAERCLRQAIEVTTEVGDTANIAVNRCNLAELLLDQHKPEDAITHLRAVLQAPQSPPITSAIALALLVEAEYVSGDIPAAQAIADEAESELARLAVLDTSLTAQLDRLRRTTGALLANSAAETSTE